MAKIFIFYLALMNSHNYLKFLFYQQINVNFSKIIDFQLSIIYYYIVLLILHYCISFIISSKY